MDQEPSPYSRLKELHVPLEGVERILSGWSGSGNLYGALAKASGDDEFERDWDERAIRARANRILIEHVRTDLARWPRSVAEWEPHLPVSSRAEVLVAPSPRGKVMWRDTASRYGWPPESFVVRRRHREVADVTVTTLAWTVDRLQEMLTQARAGDALEASDPEIDVPLQAAQGALALAVRTDSLPRPDRHDLDALATSGKPWIHVQPVASKLVRSETDLVWFAEQLLAPDESLRWRLFHLAVLGHLLGALRQRPARISWRAPMGAGSNGPNFVAHLADDTEVEVWFETAGAHQYYSGSTASMYALAARPVKASEAAIGADLGLFVPSRGEALLIEVKFSWSGSYISRNGFQQAAAYAINARSRWGRVWSYVVGPEERVVATSRVELNDGGRKDAIGFTNVQGLSSLVADFLSGRESD